MTRPSAYQCSHCNRVCCWDCNAHDDSIEEVKTIAGRYCDDVACVAAERASCNCTECRQPGSKGHRRYSERSCAHRRMPVAGGCTACGRGLYFSERVAYPSPLCFPCACLRGVIRVADQTRYRNLWARAFALPAWWRWTVFFEHALLWDAHDRHPWNQQAGMAPSITQH